MNFNNLIIRQQNIPRTWALHFSIVTAPPQTGMVTCELIQVCRHWSYDRGKTHWILLLYWA